MNHRHSSSITFFVLADSHAKLFPRTYSTSSYNLITTSISGLKWKDDNDPVRSLCALLSSSNIKSSLSRASAVLFLVGTNSVRMTSANDIILQVQQIIRFLQKNYPHLNESSKISICLTFPCFKTNRHFRTTSSLIFNINSYNNRLKVLSSQLKFNVVDLHISNDQLGEDGMHINFRFKDLIFDSIINHFNQLIRTLTTTSITSNSTPAITTTTSNPTPATTTTTFNPTFSTSSNSTADESRTSQSFSKSKEAKQYHNKRRHEKRKLKRQQHVIKIKLFREWTVPQLREYLDFLHVPYAYIPHFYKNILRLQFNSKEDKDLGDLKLKIDSFDENHYNSFINDQLS